MTRRPHGAGSLTEVRPGVWRLRVYLGRDPVTGHPEQVTKTVRTPKRGAKRQAQEALGEFVAQVGRGVPMAGRAATFDKLCQEWLAHLERIGRRPGTTETYRLNLATHVLPVLGDRRARDLTAHDLDSLYGQLSAKGLAPSTVGQHHAAISSALAQAVKWGWLDRNVAKMATPPRQQRQQSEGLSIEQVRAILERADSEDPDLAVLIALAAITGARRGELCGLRWDDVDMEAQTMRIERAIVPGQGGQHVGPTKGGAGRTVAIGDFGAGVLAGYRAILTERMLALHDELPSFGWLISYDGGATPMRAKTVSSAFSAIASRAGVPCHLHELRHFAATQMVGAGTDVRTVAARLGHADASMTLRVYAHALPERDREAANVLGRVLGNPVPNT